MKAIACSIIIAAVLAAAGCIPSINPVYFEKDLIHDPALLGTWAEPSSKESWAFTYRSEKEYRLVHTDENGKTGEFTARLAKVGDHLFLDLAPVRSTAGQDDFYSGHFLPLHTFVRVIREGKEMRISYLDPEWLKRTLAKDPGALRHERIDGEILITASTADLQRFLLSHLTTEGAFSRPETVSRKQ